MKNISSIAFFVCLACCQAFAQITGTVADAKTNELLPFANVYINNTTKGVQTDDKGNFSLSNPPSGSVQLVVSYLGYQAYQQNLIIDPAKPLTLTIRLVPLANTLSDVEVKAKRDKAWERDLKTFKREFFGELANSGKCEILNAWAIDFQNENGELIATSTFPIEVENKALGYKMFFNLREFRTSARGYRFLSATRFEEIMPKDPKEGKRWLNARRETFGRSSRQFFRSLYNNTLETDGYAIYRMDRQTDWTATNVWQTTKEYQKGENFISSNDQLLKPTITNQKTLVSELPFEVFQPRQYVTVGSQNVINANPVTRMRLLRPVSISPDGLLNDPTALEMIGYWGSERVADFLPFDYLPENPETPVVAAPTALPIGQKIYLHTNKSGYTTSDRIWFSAYLVETGSNRPLKEQQPLYLQLFNSEGFLVKDEVIYTQAGRGGGYLSLPDGLTSGVYRLRAFTRWMLNTPTQIFEKQLAIVSVKNPVGILRASDVLPNQLKDSLVVKITPTKTKYAPREKITLQLNSLFGDKPLKGSFSISVLDAVRVIPNPEDFQIGSYLSNETNKPQKIGTQYAKEQALTLTGTVQNAKRKEPIPNASVLFLLLEGEKTTQRLVQADEKGHFLMDNVDLDGTQTLSYQVNNAKGNPVLDGEVILEQMLPKIRLAPVKFDTIALAAAQRNTLQNFSTDGEAFAMPTDGVTLSELKVTAKAPEIDPNEVGITKIYSEPTYSVKFDENSPRFQNVFDMIIGQLPGVQLASYDDNGQTRYKILVRGISTFNAGALGATILLDGMQVSQDVISQSVNTNDVIRIDLLSGANAAIFGMSGGNGVVAIYTRRFRARYSGVPSVKSLILKGFQQPESFYAPEYDKGKANDKTTDQRVTIYWNPVLATDTNGEATLSFYAADAPARYKVVVEGITPSGIVGRGETWVEVR